MSDSTEVEKLREEIVALRAEIDALRECTLVGMDMTNHHNAAMCPYCSTAATKERDARTKTIRELIAAQEADDAAIASLRRALTLASHDQIDFLHVVREYVKETEDAGKIHMRTMRADAVQGRLDITREVLANTKER